MPWKLMDGVPRYVESKDSAYCDHGIALIDLCPECADDAVNDCVDAEELEDISYL